MHYQQCISMPSDNYKILAETWEEIYLSTLLAMSDGLPGQGEETENGINISVCVTQSQKNTFLKSNGIE